MTPWSPVRNQSSMNALSFASGLASYPGVTFGPRMTTSPVWPRGRILPSSSMIATSGPAGTPTVPALRARGGSGLQVIWWEASVIPKASTTGQPNVRSSSSITLGASEAEDERISRNRALRSSSACREARERIAWCMVGTAVYQVGRTSSSQWKKRRALNGGEHHTWAPAESEDSTAAIRPWMWNSGMMFRQTSSEVSCSAVRMFRADAITLRCKSGTIFGREVDPEVCSTRATSSGPAGHEVEPELVRRQSAAERRRRSSGGDRDERRGRLRTIGDDRHDAVAAADPQGIQVADGGGDQGPQLAVPQGLAFLRGADRHRAFGAPLQQIGDRLHSRSLQMPILCALRKGFLTKVSGAALALHPQAVAVLGELRAVAGAEPPDVEKAVSYLTVGRQ